MPVVVGDPKQGWSWRQAHQKLGQECGHVLVEISADFNAEAFCALAGCCRSGSLILLRLIEPKENLPPSVQRILRQLDVDSSVAYHTQETIRWPLDRTLPSDEHRVTQEDAISAVTKVVTGHRRRPLLLTADRGRGKSAALGIAAAQLMAHKPRQILVTSPTPAHASTLFFHLKARLGIKVQGQTIHYQGSQIRFIAPDELLREVPPADLLLIDEAAAIPLPMLSQWLRTYSRVAIATTEHGYEGTGRAFTIRVKQLLDVEQPQWRALTLTAPMRWADNDPVERALNSLFLLDVEQSESVEPPFFNSTHDNGRLVVECLSRHVLVKNESQLRALFALLIAAHYQTSPNDLARLLDDEAVIVFVARVDGEIVAACVVNQEGGLDVKLSHLVVAGQRRIRGHLLSQSLAANLGTPEILSDILWRVQRIAVSEPLRHRGIGQQLLAKITDHALTKKVAGLGVSFGATVSLNQFWFKQGFEPLKLGLKRDQASGCHSLQMVKPLKPLGWMTDAVELFSQSLPILLMTSHQLMEADTVASMIACLPEKPMTNGAQQQLKGFVAGGVGVDAALASLQIWLYQHIHITPDNRDNKTCHLLISRILLGQPWWMVCSRYQLSGKKQAEALIREYIAHYGVD
ncbi:GNAT family N-acetyltransferase [Salinivibrio sp. ES.052]|uniref:GNAT family N-acetyltransferase n=1 Tax=Salinivibrio sp. ES.052 TaxID=1882823 RepID=UPI0015881242|nr:GNAT family N-acetyltransferase [Salinivibrio sp. ES.052]